MLDNPRRWCAWLVVTLCGCNPALNWREAHLDAGALDLLLPCKPDRVTREVSMGGRALSLTMAGCEAGGATFAVSHVMTTDTDEAQVVLDGWKAAVLLHARAEQRRAQPFTLPKAWGIPQAARVQALGQRVSGGSVALDACWFARVDAAGVHVFHAVVLAPQPMPQASETFFASLALR